MDLKNLVQLVTVHLWRTITSTSDGLRWIMAEATVPASDFGLTGYQFTLSSNTYFNFTDMDGVTRHSMAGPSVDFTLG
ncbi:hypothetical protein [Ureibacillus sp. FSL K6-0786]|uniref:hypothetical protein n=1 Tax=Ureibacillus sp. FSL K6-0786 TaxID=2954607 RepID=UPI0030D98203